MTRLLMAIYLLLSLLLVSASCAGVQSEPPTPLEQIAPPIGPTTPANEGGIPTLEAAEPLGTAPEPNEAESLRAGRPASAEPNAPAASERPRPTAHEETDQPPDQAVAPEPDLVDESEPNTPAIAEPNDAPPAEPIEPVSAEPNEPMEIQLPVEAVQAQDVEPGDAASFYQEYAELLQQYVRTDGRVDYDGLRRKRLRLRELLAQPDELDPGIYRKWTPDEKLALWINVYNLKMLDIIARNYPVQSSWWLRLTWPPSDIRHIEGIWSQYRFIVMDEEFTLGEVERRFFAKTFADPRAFLATTYAGRSSPPLRRTPYRGRELGRQLNEQVKAFLTDGQGVRIDRDKGVVYLSALFKPAWRGKEFLARYGTDKKFKNRVPETRAVLNFITRYLGANDVYFLEVENYSLEYTNFDWRLNDASTGY